VSNVAGGGERVPCVHCGEGIFSHARLCPHCRLSALVDVTAVEALDDRRRYSLSRALLGSGLLGPASLAAIQLQLKATPPCLGRGLTQEQAGKVIAVAREAGVESLKTGAEPPAPARETPPRKAAVPSATKSDARFLAIGLVALVVITIGVQMARSRSVNADLAMIALQTPPAPIRSAPQVIPTPTPTRTRSVPRKALESVVAIRCGNQSGAGFFVGPELVLTNAHVLCGQSTPVQVSTMDGHKGLGQVQRLDDYLDLGLVHVRMSGEPRKPLPFADASLLTPGTRVFLAGSPKGLDFTFHEGTVSRVGQPILGLAYVQVDARINPGNSGGPLLDEEGRVVGVVSMKMEGEGLGLALPINYAIDAEKLPFLPSVEGWVSSDGFQRIAAAAKIEANAVEGQLAESLDTAAIIRIRSDAYGRPLILVGRIASKEPPAEDMRFEFRSGSEVLCWRTAHTAHWQEELKDLPLPPRMAAWLKERRMSLRLFTTEVSPGLSGCPALRGRSVSIVLQGGEQSDSASRLH
jgi:S1-C subfamily serine protease